MLYLIHRLLRPLYTTPQERAIEDSAMDDTLMQGMLIIGAIGAILALVAACVLLPVLLA